MRTEAVVNVHRAMAVENENERKEKLYGNGHSVAYFEGWRVILMTGAVVVAVIGN